MTSLRQRRHADLRFAGRVKAWAGERLNDVDDAHERGPVVDALEHRHLRDRRVGFLSLVMVKERHRGNSAIE
jgi:hypothetical protein